MGNDFGNIIANGQFLIAVPIAVLAGLVSFASPCILPLVPGYLAYVGGMAGSHGNRSRRRVIVGVTLFILGFAAVFIAYGAAFGSLGSWLIRWQDPITRIMGILLVAMGLVFIGALPQLQRTIRLPIRPNVGLAGAPLLGLVFGLGWTPCLGPTLAAISALSLGSATVGRGTALAAFYCIGLGIPFLLVALGFEWASGGIRWLKEHVRTINIAGGAALILIGVLMVSGLWTMWLYQLQALIGGVVLPI
ncbi:cytochrome c biogenesis protein CcdA [Glaciihabitans sp. UYNi722]|uniref:cytochrome c biogenesis CcdA family protein n=1 Tax=Glaciihabitans sp. UYNi722 TaxID=3156344 RepID=UPI003391B4F4